MRVLMVTNTYAPARNGVAMWVDLSVREMRARGHTVDVLTYRHDRRERGLSGVHEVRSWFGIDPDFRVDPLPSRIPASLASTSWDIVHVHHPILLGPLGVRFARENGAKVCATFHSMYSDYFDEYYGGAGRFLRDHFDARVARFADRCDVVFAPSSRVERWLRQHEVSARTVRVQPPADTSRIRCETRDRARAALGLGPRPIAFYIGRIADEKRVGTLVEEFASALGTMPPDAQLVLAGSGRRVAQVRRLVRRAGLGDRVRMLGSVTPDELGLWYSAADVCTSASRSETGPLTVVEAMACACPYVALQAPGFEDRIVDGLNGLLVPDEPGRLGTALAAVLSDPSLRQRLSAGTQAVACECSPSAVTGHMLDVYGELLA